MVASVTYIYPTVFSEFKWIGYTCRGSNSLNFVLSPPFEMESTLKGKNLLIIIFFIILFLEKTPVSEATCCAGKQTRSHKSCLPCKKWRIIYN